VNIRMVALNMGLTIVEKILSRHAGKQSRAGDVVWIDLDIRSARDFGGANVVKSFMREYPGDPVADPRKTLFTFDCVAPAVTIAYATNQQMCREFARSHGIRVFDVDAGIGSHVMIEHGYVLPGSTVVGTDSHMNIVGAVGAFGQGMGDTDIVFAFRTGRTWFEVPETIKITLEGCYEFPITAKDLTLHVLGKLGSKGALGKAIEFYGEQIERMNLAERLTLSSMATEMGAIAAFMAPSENVLAYCRERAPKGAVVEAVFADANARYCHDTHIDISGLPPQIAAPPKPSNVKEVSAYRGRKVDSVFIGSCTNGRLEDLEAAARVLGNRSIRDGVMMKVVPATREVYQAMLENGLLKRFFNAGAIVSHACCAGCASGQIGMTGKGEVQVSTSNRNFAGKQGEGETFLASPVTAAAAALAGEIVPPEEVLSAAP
jgi:3-isopropylmalate/(R)-2-methylmalate dehydratase large subunit